ncbi:MAG TPA: acyl carrier protein [Syntrophus sp. (in: bacteria)]|jgi:acyl carrier protein|nr:acyl carrier protein [Syntrophus sp. (in: bacteria)]
MADTLKKLKLGIEDLFPEVGSIAVTGETRLGDIPDFDSMAAVNLQTFIEENFKVAIPLDLLGEDTTLKDIVNYIEDPSLLAAAEKQRS